MKLAGLAASLLSPRQNNKIHITIVTIVTVVIQLSGATACVKHWGGKRALLCWSWQSCPSSLGIGHFCSAEHQHCEIPSELGSLFGGIQLIAINSELLILNW